MTIKIKNLELITLYLFSKLKKNIGDEIEIKTDYYWDIHDDSIFNPYEEPEELTLGQLSDDIEELEKYHIKDMATSYDMKRLSSIFRALSKESQGIW